jgi:hypothetical protein
MRHGHIMPIHRIAGRHRLCRRVEMGHNLMPIKIKIDPLLRAAPLATAQNIPIKGAGGREIVNRKSKMKRTHRRSLARWARETKIENKAIRL